MWLLAVCVFVLACDRLPACQWALSLSVWQLGSTATLNWITWRKWMDDGCSEAPPHTHFVSSSFLFTFFNIYRLQTFSSAFVLLLRVIPASFWCGLAHRCCSSWCQSCGDEAEDWIKIFNTNVKPNVMHWLPLHLPHCIVCLTVNAIVLFLSYLLSVQLSANTPHQLESSPIRVPEVFGQETLLRQSGQMKLDGKTRPASIRG